MPKIHALRSGQPPSSATVIAERPWNWCSDNLGSLKRLAPLNQPRAIVVWANESERSRRTRGNEIVLVELEGREGEWKPGYYHCRSIELRDLNKLLGKMPNPRDAPPA